MTRLSVGVVGCGLIAQKRHIPCFAKLGRKVSVVAVCDINLGLAKEVGRSFGIPRTYADVAEMLSKEKLDVVDICTPPQSHREVAIEAMEEGSHVLLEKPMALTVVDCQDMIRVSRSQGVKLSVMHNERFYPPYATASKMARDGSIGDVVGMRIMSATCSDDFMARKDHWVHKLKAGVIGETGPHVVYLSLPFIGNVTDIQVSAKKALAFPWVMFDRYFIELAGKSITSSIVVSHATKYTAMDIDILGTDGMIRLDLQSMLLSVYARKSIRPVSLGLSALGVSRRIATGVLSNAFAGLLGKSFIGHYYLARDFIKSIDTGGPLPVTPEEGLETTRVMEQISSRCAAQHMSGMKVVQAS